MQIFAIYHPFWNGFAKHGELKDTICAHYNDCSALHSIKELVIVGDLKGLATRMDDICGMFNVKKHCYYSYERKCNFGLHL